MVRRGELIAEIASDKGSFEVEAEDDGVFHPHVREGSSQSIGTVIAQITPPGEVMSDTLPVARRPGTSAVGLSGEKAPTVGSEVLTEPAVAERTTLRRASPLARKLAHELDVDLSLVIGSGPGGLVVKGDVLAAGSRGRTTRGHRTRERPTGVQLAIANRMVAAKGPVPHFYAGVEVRMDAAVRAMTSLRESVTDGPRVTLTHLLVKASALALSRHPDFNRAWVDDYLETHSSVDIAVAVAVPGGLVAPVVRGVDRKTLLEIAEESSHLVQRARLGELRRSELTGATFAVSNLGMYGVDDFIAIVSLFEAAILAAGRVQKRPVVQGGRVEVGQVVRLNLSCDHRVVYGAEAASFLVELRNLLEDPAPWASR